MATISEALAVAVQYHQSGNLQQAEAIYRQVLQVDPNNVDALHLLGVIAGQMGKHDLAVEYISQAIRIRPSDAVLHHNLGKALKDQGQLGEAAEVRKLAGAVSPIIEEASVADARQYNERAIALARQGKLVEAAAFFRQALRLWPDFAEAHSNLGNVLQEQGQLAAAVAQYQEAIRLKPNYAEACSNLGNALREHGQTAEAVAQCEEALRLKPDFAEAHYNLGNALRDQGQLAEAVGQYQEAFRLKPDYVEAHNNLGLALQDQGQLAEAVAQYQEALRLKPDLVEAHNNLGLALQDQDQLAEAVGQYQEALRLKPDYVEAHNNLGLALQDQGQLAKAVAQYQEAIRLKPDLADAHNNLALTWLLAGDFQQGWPEHEWPWQIKQMRRGRPSFPSLFGKARLLGKRPSYCGWNKVWGTRCSSFAMLRSSNSRVERYCSCAPLNWSGFSTPVTASITL